MNRCGLIVLDGLGIGEAPDAEAYGDGGSDTLGNVARAVGGLSLPNLERIGLGCCRPLTGMVCEAPTAAHGVAVPASAGKDSTTGHWELCGLLLDTPFPTFPHGFPEEILAPFRAETGRGVLANHPASGTAVIEEYGPQHLATGDWIVYTSADSVFQIAAHERVVPLDELERAARHARAILRGKHAVSRVITRPFVGEPGAFRRTEHRRDFSIDPVGPTLLDRLADAGIARLGVGKVDDLFAGRNISSTHAARNTEAYRLIREGWARLDRGLLFANVIEFDQSWGHRNDVPGYQAGLQELDAAIPTLEAMVETGDLLIFTADHGNDPTTPSTDHSRENVPILVLGPGVEPVSVGLRTTYADIGATVAEFFGVESPAGTSFLSQVWEG